MCISEHKLMSFNKNEYKNTFQWHDMLLTCDDEDKITKDINHEIGVRGVGIMWKKEEDYRVTTLQTGHKRYCAIKYETGYQTMFIVSVYCKYLLLLFVISVV